jgi:hypothetical protein
LYTHFGKKEEEHSMYAACSDFGETEADVGLEEEGRG